MTSIGRSYFVAQMFSKCKKELIFIERFRALSIFHDYSSERIYAKVDYLISKVNNSFLNIFNSFAFLNFFFL